MSKVWRWVLGVVTALGAICAFVLWRKYQGDHVDTLTDALVVARAETEVAVLDAKREALEADIEDRDEEIAIVKDALVENKRSIVVARTKAGSIEGEEAILAEYRRLGYI